MMAYCKGERRSSNTQWAAEELRRQILCGDLVPGASYLETDLAERLGMSRTPVREAALILQVHGLVEVVPRHGVRVRKSEAVDIEEIYDIIAELSSLAIMGVVERVAAGDLTRCDIDELIAGSAAIDRAEQENDPTAWLNAYDVFNAAIQRMSNSSRITAMLRSLDDQVFQVRARLVGLHSVPIVSARCHRRIVDAVEIGDVDFARSATRMHYNVVRDALIARFHSEIPQLDETAEPRA